MFVFMKNMFIGLLSFNGSLASMNNVSSHTACISLNNQLCVARPTFIDLNFIEYK